MWGYLSLDFWGCFSQSHRWKEDSRAELNFPTHKAQRGWGVAQKSQLPPCWSQAAQILSNTALAALGASHHGGKQDFTRPGYPCRKHNAFPAPGPGRLPGRVQHAFSLQPQSMAQWTTSSRISLHGSSSFSSLTCITPKMKHRLAENISLAEGALSAMHMPAYSLACSLHCRFTKKLSGSEGRRAALQCIMTSC